SSCSLRSIGLRVSNGAGIRRLSAVTAMLGALTAVASRAADLIVFGPETFQRGTGQPASISRTFRNAGPTDGYTLRVQNHGVTSGTITLNGKRIVAEGDFESDGSAGKEQGKGKGDDRTEAASLIERALTLRPGDNQLVVELRGKPGTSATVEIDRPAPATDTTPPTITAAVTPAPNANGWNNATVTVSFRCADAGSGIAVCPAPVVVSN